MRRVKELGVKEVEQGPELMEVVLEWSPYTTVQTHHFHFLFSQTNQKQSFHGTQLPNGDPNQRLLALDPLTLIENDVPPGLTLKPTLPITKQKQK
jgi:hypothetical protein